MQCNCLTADGLWPPLADDVASQLGYKGRESLTAMNFKGTLPRFVPSSLCPDVGRVLFLQQRENPRLILQNCFLILQKGVEFSLVFCDHFLIL